MKKDGGIETLLFGPDKPLASRKGSVAGAGVVSGKVREGREGSVVRPVSEGKGGKGGKGRITSLFSLFSDDLPVSSSPSVIPERDEAERVPKETERVSVFLQSVQHSTAGNTQNTYGSQGRTQGQVPSKTISGEQSIYSDDDSLLIRSGDADSSRAPQYNPLLSISPRILDDSTHDDVIAVITDLKGGDIAGDVSAGLGADSGEERELSDLLTDMWHILEAL